MNASKTTAARFVIALIAALAVLSFSVYASRAPLADGASGRICFSAQKWGPAPDAVRPCVEITKLYEDGSFQFSVSDADGTIRYTSGVGAQDR